MQVAVEHVTLVDSIFPSIRLSKRVALALIFSGLIALSAQFRIILPFTPIPITGQTLAVVLTGALLGSRLGVLAILFYLAEGALGLPVFQGGTGGWFRFLGPTGGYLMSYVVAVYVVGRLAERGWDRRFLTSLLMMGLGQAVVLTLGAAFLARFMSVEQALLMGAVPFLPGDAGKSLVAAAVLPSGWKLLARWNQTLSPGSLDGDD